MAPLGSATARAAVKRALRSLLEPAGSLAEVEPGGLSLAQAPVAAASSRSSLAIRSGSVAA